MTTDLRASILAMLARYQQGDLAGADLARELIEDDGLPDDLESLAQSALDEYGRWLSSLSAGNRMNYDPDALFDSLADSLEKAVSQ